MFSHQLFLHVFPLLFHIILNIILLRSRVGFLAILAYFHAIRLYILYYILVFLILQSYNNYTYHGILVIVNSSFYIPWILFVIY